MADGIDRHRKAYETDFSDGQWAIIEPLFPATKPGDGTSAPLLWTPVSTEELPQLNMIFADNKGLSRNQ